MRVYEGACPSRPRARRRAVRQPAHQLPRIHMRVCKGSGEGLQGCTLSRPATPAPSPVARSASRPTTFPELR